MQQEVEVKFLNVDHDTVRRKLQDIGATCEQPMRLMRRAIIDYPDRHLQMAKSVWGWVRVRDEGDKITLTYKQQADDPTATTHEIEFEISDFEKALTLFEAIGLQVESRQESKRETWRWNDVEIVLDEWPWLKPYIEIEGPSTESIQLVAQKLGFLWENAFYGNTTVAYKVEYPGIADDETIGNIPDVRFGQLIPEWLESRR